MARGTRSFALLTTLYRSPFIRSTGVLSTGALLAQLIPLMMLPIFARSFPASSFGILALLQTGGALLAILATGAYELAIPTPRQPARARGLATLALYLSCLAAAVALLAVAGFHTAILRTLHTPQMAGWLYAYPAIMLGLSWVSIATYWLLRAGKLVPQASLKLSLTLCVAILTLCLRPLPDGLLYGYLGGVLCAMLWATIQAMRHGFFPARASVAYFSRLLRSYGHFPLFGSLPSLIQNTAAQIPLLIVTAYYSLSLAGHYAVARNILLAGTNLIALSAGQILLRQIAERRHASARIWPYFIQVALGLGLLSAAATVAIWLLGPWFFRLYLGAGWEDMGMIVRILSINVALWIMGMALGSAMVAVQKIRTLGYWQLLYGALSPGLFLLTRLPFAQFLWYSALFEAALYGFYLACIFVTMRRFDRTQQVRHAT